MKKEKIMNLPIKCGQMYIKFDDNGGREYAYLVKNRIIQRVLNLRNDDKEINEFVLPDFGFDKDEGFWGGTVNKAHLLEIKKQYAKKNSYGVSAHSMERYLEGSVKIAEDSFKLCKNIGKDLRIVVPGDYSIMLYHSAFEDKTKCNFILKNDMDLFTVLRSFYDGFGYNSEYWHLIAHKELEGMESLTGMMEQRSFRKYNANENILLYNDKYSVSHEQ